jgi:hypothetical protein
MREDGAQRRPSRETDWRWPRRHDATYSPTMVPRRWDVSSLVSFSRPRCIGGAESLFSVSAAGTLRRS